MPAAWLCWISHGILKRNPWIPFPNFFVLRYRLSQGHSLYWYIHSVTTAGILPLPHTPHQPVTRSWVICAQSMCPSVPFSPSPQLPARTGHLYVSSGLTGWTSLIHFFTTNPCPPSVSHRVGRRRYFKMQSGSFHFSVKSPQDTPFLLKVLRCGQETPKWVWPPTTFPNLIFEGFRPGSLCCRHKSYKTCHILSHFRHSKMRVLLPRSPQKWSHLLYFPSDLHIVGFSLPWS